eukprot:7383786-Prymnesium_polylepis.1
MQRSTPSADTRVRTVANLGCSARRSGTSRRCVSASVPLAQSRSASALDLTAPHARARGFAPPRQRLRSPRLLSLHLLSRTSSPAPPLTRAAARCAS